MAIDVTAYESKFAHKLIGSLKKILNCFKVVEFFLGAK